MRPEGGASSKRAGSPLVGWLVIVVTCLFFLWLSGGGSERRLAPHLLRLLGVIAVDSLAIAGLALGVLKLGGAADPAPMTIPGFFVAAVITAGASGSSGLTLESGGASVIVGVIVLGAATVALMRKLRTAERPALAELFRVSIVIGALCAMVVVAGLTLVLNSPGYRGP